MIEKYVLDNSGSGDDAKDVFQDAMFLLIKKVQDSNFELTSKLSTFLFGIGRHLWLKKLTQKKINTEEYQNEISISETEDFEEEDIERLEQARLMKEGIDKLGEPCKTIIVEFYFLKTSMQDIAEKLNYTNANNAKNQKYKCFKRLQKLMSKGE